MSTLSPQAIFEREAKFGAHNYAPIPVAISKGKGIYFKHGILKTILKQMCKICNLIFSVPENSW